MAHKVPPARRGRATIEVRAVGFDALRAAIQAHCRIAKVCLRELEVSGRRVMKAARATRVETVDRPGPETKRGRTRR